MSSCFLWTVCLTLSALFPREAALRNCDRRFPSPHTQGDRCGCVPLYCLRRTTRTRSPPSSGTRHQVRVAHLVHEVVLALDLGAPRFVAHAPSPFQRRRCVLSSERRQGWRRPLLQRGVPDSTRPTLDRLLPHGHPAYRSHRVHADKQHTTRSVRKGADCFKRLVVEGGLEFNALRFALGQHLGKFHDTSPSLFAVTHMANRRALSSANAADTQDHLFDFANRLGLPLLHRLPHLGDSRPLLVYHLHDLLLDH